MFYIHSDHLGSTSLMSDADGYKVETSVGRYLPYGRWRTAPTATRVQFQYQVSTAANPFTVSDASLEEEIPGYAVTRKTYFLGGSKQTAHLLTSV